MDVTKSPYFADPTGTEDATAAIQAAMDDHDGNEANFRKRSILYFPNGIYRLTAPLILDTHDEDIQGGGSGRGIIFQGESRDGAILKLDDAATGFGDSSNPRILVDFNQANELPGSWQFVGFQVHIKDLSIDVGRDNPGAIGLDFAANNCGGLENILIKSPDPSKAGHTGLLLSNLPGPQFFTHIEVDGFDYGIRTESHANYQTTMEDIVVRNSRINAVQNNLTSMTIHRLQTDHIGQAAIQNNNRGGFMVLINAQFQNGDGAHPAIENNGFLYARRITAQGHSHLITDHIAGNLKGPGISEWYSGSAEVLFPTDPLNSMNLPIEDAPEIPLAPASEWVSVLDFGAVRNNDASGAAVSETIDDAPAFQAALDSMGPGQVNEGKATLYFPSGQYIFKTGVTIPSHVERIIGCYSYIQPLADAKDSVPCFTIAGGGGDPLIIEQVTTDWSDRRPGEDTAGPGDYRRATPFIKNESDRTVVLKDIWVTSGQVYKNTGSGKLFIENVSGTSSRYGGIVIPEPLPSAIPQFDFGSQDVWARQLNAEQKNLNTLSDGGDVWFLGIKDEEDGTFLKVINGGRAEVLGGVLMPLDVDNQAQPGFELVDSAMTVVIPTHTRSSPKKKPGGLFTGYYDLFYDVFVRETQGGQTRDLLTADLTQDRAYYNPSPKVLTLFRGSVFSAAENWRLTHFGSPDNAGDAADSANPDGDMLVNLQERAFGRDPLSPDEDHPVQGGILPFLGEPYFTLTHDRLAFGSITGGNSYTASGIEYSIQATGESGTPWNSASASLILHQVPVDNGDGSESVIFRSIEPLDGGNDSRLFRVLLKPVP
ncbi:MAG: glycosyl hydrolase family 28-related protein [Oceanipulchritudo sp.]